MAVPCSQMTVAVSQLFPIDRLEWPHAPAAKHVPGSEMTNVLESGDVVFLPALRFVIQPDEAVLFTPSILGSAKNASFDPATGHLGGTTASGGEAALLRSLMQRFSDAAL